MLLAAGLMGLAMAPAQAQFIQQGEKLTASGLARPVNQGIVALSADGNTALIGGPADHGGVGAVWVWTRTGGVWAEEAKLVGTGAEGSARQGISVALSGDGNTAVAGGFLDHGGAGAVWVWVRRGGVWSQEGKKLAGAGAVGGAYQGYSVALSTDGNTALAGGYNDAGGVGAAWVWTRTGGVWAQQGHKMIGGAAMGAACQGYSVALSGDGNTALVGGFFDNSGVGAVWAWTRAADTWKQEGPKLVGGGAAGRAYQGISVALSSDANTALVGGFSDDDGAGAVWVWTHSSGVWKQQGKKLVGAGAVGSAYQGVSVALSATGNTALAGGFLDDGGAGAVWVWTRSGSVWTQQGAKLVGAGAAGKAGQGRIVALSADGGTALAGGAFDDGNAGAAWVYVLPVDVSGQVTVTQTDFTPGRDRGASNWTAALTVTNSSTAPGRDERGSSASPIYGPLNIVFTRLSRTVTLVNGTGAVNGAPYITVAVDTLGPGESVNVALEFANPANVPISFTPVVYSGRLR